MVIFVYLDESGSIHHSSNTKYFAIGGYLVSKEDNHKTISTYKRLNKHIKDRDNIPLENELKSFNLAVSDKITIFKSIQQIRSYIGCAKVFNKIEMKKKITDVNVFYNYGVKLLFDDCVLKLVDLDRIGCHIDFIVNMDNRSISVGKLKDLETYLNTEYCLYDVSFKVTYYDSKTNYGIQLADLTVNTFYNVFKDISIVEDVFKVLKPYRYRVSTFPGNMIVGRKRPVYY